MKPEGTYTCNICGKSWQGQKLHLCPQQASFATPHCSAANPAPTCPICNAAAVRLADVACFFVLHDESHAAGRFDCPEHGQFIALNDPPAMLPEAAGSDLEQDSYIHQCRFCGHDRARIAQVLPVTAGAARFVRAGNLISGQPFSGLAVSCPKCKRGWFVADPNCEVNALKS